MDFKHFVSFCLLYLTQSGPLRKKCCQHCRGYLSWTLETETCFLGHIPLVNLTLSHIQLLTDWTVRYTPPIHWYEWQLVFSVFRHSPLCQSEQLFFTKPRNVWCHIVQLVFSPTNSRLWGFFFSALLSVTRCSTNSHLRLSNVLLHWWGLKEADGFVIE